MTTDFTSGSKPERLKELLSFGLDGSIAEEEIQPSSPLDLFIEKPGSRIGSYELKRVLGEGSMAVVYLAQQQQPVKRLVALKIIKPGMDSKAIISRFDAERQALALLDHPNIAHIYDAGATEDRRPYFAMEYVEGLTITEYCDRNRLSIKERLHLFLMVCLAVHHAHQKGIIHRDIKPSNILVSLHDGQPVPKVIDFGLVKAISGSLSGRTLVTEQDQLLGTPEYMSPEQADMANEDIDIRSDIYSLGVLLYVLLIGVLPFDSETLREGGIEHILQVIRDNDHKTPSTRLTSLGDKAQKMAESRRTEVATLVRCLHKELEWIPLRAMRKERSERYQSASELAEDIESYLKGDALTAGPPSTIYRLKKIARRNRALITGIAAVIVVSIAGTVVSTSFAIRAKRQARTSQAVSDFLVNDLLSPNNPAWGTKREVTVELLMDVATERLEGKFVTEPVIEAYIRQIIGYAYFNLGNFEAAESNLKRAIKLRKESVGTEDLQTLRLMMGLGWVYIQYSMYDKAESILEDTVDGMRVILSDVDWNLLEATSRLAWVYYKQERFEEAEKLQAGALEVVQRKLGPEHPYAPNHMEGLAFVYWEQGHREKALKLNKKALEINLRDPDWNLGETANISKSLAWMYMELDRYSEAEEMYIRALDVMRQIDGEEHRGTLKSVGELGSLYRKWKRYDKAQEYLMQELETRQRVFGDEDEGTLDSMIRVAELYRDQEQFEDAEQLLIKAEETARRVLGNDHEITNTSMNNLITLYETWGKPEKAKEWRTKKQGKSQKSKGKRN
jgi:non-specific serine/threonine protein kinase/serine/threonine-protein kinase